MAPNVVEVEAQSAQEGEADDLVERRMIEKTWWAGNIRIGFFFDLS